jgi:hypothetical protein
LELHELTLALHTLCAIQSTHCTQCPLPPPRLGSTAGVCGKKQTPCACEYGSRGCCWDLRHQRHLRDLVVLTPPLPAINGSTDTQRGLNRRYAQDNILQLYSSETARRTALPMPTQKAKSHRRAGAGGDGTARVVESLSGGVETLLSTLHHAHIPFGPSVSALRSAVYFEDAHPHPATPADSLAYTTQWADRVTTSPHTNWAVCTTPSELRLCYLSHQSINAEMYVILQIPNPIQRKLCHVSVRVKTPAAADPSSEKETDSL